MDTELRDVFHATYRESVPTSFLRTAWQYLEQARPLIEHDGSALAVDRLLNDAERYLHYAEFTVIADNKKRADPATYTALRARLQALFETPVPDIGS